MWVLKRRSIVLKSRAMIKIMTEKIAKKVCEI